MIRFLTLIWIFTLLFFGGISCFAQTSFTSTQLLANDLQPDADMSLLLQNNLQFLKESKQGMPFVEKMEFRTETDRLDFERQEYQFRMSFNKGRSRKVQDKITKNNIKLYETRTQIINQAELAKRYKMIIDWHYGQLELERLKALKILAEDKKTVYQKMLLNALVIEIDDLLKVEEGILELDRDISKAERLKAHAIRQLFPGQSALIDYTLEADSWISVERMESFLKENKTLPLQNLEQTQKEVQVDFLQLEYDLEKSEEKKILDFVQVKYAQREDLEVHRELSLGLGFNIPTKSSARVKLNEDMLDILNEQYEQQLITSNLEEKIAAYYAEFDMLIEEYRLIQQQISANRLEATYEKYSTTEEVNPLTLLRIKESVLENKRLVKEIEKEVCLLFLEILKCKGLIHQTPTRNYLSDDLPTF